MPTRYTGLAVGLLTLLLTAGCETKCEIRCADGFKTTWPHECNDDLTNELAKDHGGSCTGDEHKY